MTASRDKVSPVYLHQGERDETTALQGPIRFIYLNLETAEKQGGSEDTNGVGLSTHRTTGNDSTSAGAGPILTSWVSSPSKMGSFPLSPTRRCCTCPSPEQTRGTTRESEA